MKKTPKLILGILLSATLCFCSCDNYIENPNAPDVMIDMTIYPNSTYYFDLNTVSGWMFLTAPAPSRGIIVYRINWDEFRAYDRIPPNFPYACCDDEGNCSRLIVEFPFVKDDCSDIKYNILDGSIFLDNTGEAVYPLIQYQTFYDGNELRIFN